MKDVQGIHRGKCTCGSCECDEYRTSPQQSSLRCEYCNHTPVDHVRIIELGACSSCGKDECSKYQSESKNKYTDCEYCGCSAQLHSGSEKLRKPRPQGQQQPGASGQGMAQPRGFQPRHDAHDQPLQLPAYGVCSAPGCTFPKRKDGDKIHDFCSRTCAKKYNDMEAKFFQQKVTASKTAQSGSPKGSARSQPPPQGGSMSNPPPNSMISAIINKGPSSLSGGSLPPAAPSQQGAPTGGKLCSKCRVRQANPGKGWCQQCFTQSQ